MRKKNFCKKSQIIIFLVLLSFSFSAHAQISNLQGRVVDADNIPLIGVNVIQKGTTNGIVTDIDGNFSIDVPVNSTIVFSYIGFSDEEVVWDGSGDLNIVLSEDSELLDELVVVGYGTQKRVNLTGAVSTVTGDDLNNRLSHSVTNMLQGSVAGLNITTSSGRPGTTGAINIRGVNSINDADPLVVIDGVTGDAGDLSRLNPNDIESISVIKDASAAAVYGARAAFGVILVTTKSGVSTDKKAVVRYSGRIGWEQPTTSTDYENRGYYSVYHVNKFWQADNGTNYIRYSDRDMDELWARVNDVTEHPDRPWVVEEVRGGRNQWVYYGNYDWWDMLYREKRPVQKHSVSLNGGSKGVKYLVSGAYDRQEGIQKQSPDVFQKYNLRSKIDFDINKWATLSNNTSFYTSKYNSLGDGSVDNTLGYSARHALANIPMQNPDGSWVYGTPYSSYKVANGRHIILGEESHRLTNITSDFSNTSRLVITPIKPLSITADFTYRLYQTRNVSRSNPMPYREYPDTEMEFYSTGAGDNRLDEYVNTRDYYSTNVFATYNQTFNNVHNFTAVTGLNYESLKLKNLSAWGRNLSSSVLDDLDLVGQDTEGNTVTGVERNYQAGK